MDAANYPLRQQIAWSEWSPNIHYAKYQTLQSCTFPERRLYDFEIICVVRGTLIAEMRAETHVVNEGRMIFLPSRVRHRNEVVAPDSGAEAKLLGIHFDFDGKLTIATESDMVVDEREEHPDKFAEEAVASGFSPLSDHAVYDCSAECLQWMDRLVEEFTMRPNGYELVCRGLMLNILVSMMRSGTAQSRAGMSPYADRIKRLIEKMEREPAAPWPSHRIAKELKVSEDYALKLFRQVAGMPPGQLLKAIRHREARRLLRETDWSIEVVGERVGYPDLHYFSRLFSMSEGISPREYRKMSRIL